MSNFILTGLFTEGATDIRFLESVINKVLYDIAFDCNGDVVSELIEIKINKKGLSFVDQVLNASLQARRKFDIRILFVHTDSDNINDDVTFESKIIPAQAALNTQNDDDYCKIIVAVVPVQMTEGWMLADKELLKSEIGTDKSDFDLGIHRDPESTNNPKEKIENAIRISERNQTRRRRGNGLLISDLSQIIGQKIELEQLEKLPSFIKFKESLKDAFVQLNLLQ